MNYNNSTKGYELIGGIDGMLFMTIAEYYNITYDVINNNGVWGAQPINNTWSGVIGMLQSKVLASYIFGK